MHVAIFQEIFTDIHNGIGSIHTTLIHMFSGLWIWRTRWQGGMPDTMLQPKDFPTLEAIRERWETEEHLMHDFLATLHDEDLLCEIRYIGTMVPGKSSLCPCGKQCST